MQNRQESRGSVWSTPWLMVIASMACAVHAESLSAQTTIVTGEVRSEAGAPVDFASVDIEGTRYNITTDKEGQFSFAMPDELRGKTVIMMAHQLGYSASRVPVTLSEPVIPRNFTLKSCPMSFLDPSDGPERDPPLPTRSILTTYLAIGDLEHQPHASDAREVRVWLWNDDISPFELFRFVENAGRRTGERVSSTWGAWRCRHEGSGKTACGRPSDSGTIPDIDELYICRKRERGAEDWPALWSSVQSNGAMRLRHSYRHYTAEDIRRNSHYMTIESWDGRRYRIGSYELQLGADSVANTDAETLVAAFARARVIN
jgi:hypothetical protein